MSKNAKISQFPPGVVLEIEVVFSNEYRIGYRFKNIHYLPGSSSYFSFNKALNRCWAAFLSRFTEDGNERTQEDGTA